MAPVSPPAVLDPQVVLKKQRRICLPLPTASEAVKWGHPNFLAGKKIFAAFEQYKGVWSICFKVPKRHQGLFLKDPRFYRTPYVGQHGWVSLRSEGRLDWKEIAELVEGSYQLVIKPPRS